MTERECAIVEAYTGICMLAGEKRYLAYKYEAEIMGRPVWTHEWANPETVAAIKEAARPDFVELCRTATPDPNWK